MRVDGVRLSAVHCGLKAGGGLDLALLELAPGSVTAAVFTQNAFCAAPVQIARRNLAYTTPRALLVNAGNANAGTGRQGLENAESCCVAAASALDCDHHEILPFSTGVIGEPLPVHKIAGAIDGMCQRLDPGSWDAAATAIMTTDTRPKLASHEMYLAGETITITGMAKGAGMIKPNMATMLAFVATDAEVGFGDLQRLLEAAVEDSFNCISVDGDTSTNDACTLTATGKSGVRLRPSDDAWPVFAHTVKNVFVELAQALIEDAEGASKFVTVRVQGGANRGECFDVAYAIAESPLVKTALFASDANWGRILAAVGRAGVPGLDVSHVNIDLDDVRVVTAGERDARYQDTDGQRILAQDRLSLSVDLGRGLDKVTVWTCDLSHDYVRINAEYRS
ncbi:MAG: bifunctional glutamate N-acetyltransferase/amino-acid acetyltransferase ArgJ [Gammaproteobacteria bacterium]|nr:bifunctional glutamate N-acetyltransferase/amino-acid acetyltransferase ArgJ [Gammaproteobacteria bacterium]